MALDGNGLITINWPCNCINQAAVVRTMLIDIEAQDTLIRSKGRKQMQIFSKSQPSIGQWQTQWITQGNSLPIPNGVEALWFDTTNNTYGGQFYVVNGVPYPVEMRRYRGIKSITIIPDVPPYGTSVAASTTGVNHWSLTDVGGGAPQAATFTFNVPAHMIGKNYYVKFNLPFAITTSQNVNWTVWAESANQYTTLYGGAGELGFGVISAIANRENIIEWVAEVPAGGVATTIEVRVASATSGGGATTFYNFPLDGGGSVVAGGGVSRTTAEFILKTE